jgi:hypothetical protein
MVDFLSQALATLIGAFAGAYFAYRYERKKNEAEELRGRAAAVNLATLALWQIITATRRYKRDVIDVVPKDEDLWWKFMGSSVHSGELPKIDYAGLQFLNDTKEPKVLTALVSRVTHFAALRDLVDRHSLMHITEFQPALEKANLSLKDRTSDAVERAVGPRLTTCLRAYTKGIVDLAEEMLVLAEQAHADLLRLAKPLVGKHKLPFIMPDVRGMPVDEAIAKIRASAGESMPSQRSR